MELLSTSVSIVAEIVAQRGHLQGGENSEEKMLVVKETEQERNSRKST